MAQVTITINSREYAIACDDGQERHIMNLARMLDDKAKMLTAGGGHINENMLLAMVGLLMADELSELRKQNAGQSQAPQQVQTIEKVVEKIVEPDLSAVDAEIADALQKVVTRISDLAQEIAAL